MDIEIKVIILEFLIIYFGLLILYYLSLKVRLIIVECFFMF